MSAVLYLGILYALEYMMSSTSNKSTALFCLEIRIGSVFDQCLFFLIPPIIVCLWLRDGEHIFADVTNFRRRNLTVQPMYTHSGNLKTVYMGAATPNGVYPRDLFHVHHDDLHVIQTINRRRM